MNESSESVCAKPIAEFPISVPQGIAKAFCRLEKDHVAKTCQVHIRAIARVGVTITTRFEVSYHAKCVTYEQGADIDATVFYVY